MRAEGVLLLLRTAVADMSVNQNQRRTFDFLLRRFLIAFATAAAVVVAIGYGLRMPAMEAVKRASTSSVKHILVEPASEIWFWSYR